MKPELVRQLHEDIDRHVEEVVIELQHEPKVQRHRMQHEHFIGERLDRVQQKRRKLASIYAEQEQAPEETLPLSGVVQSFYDGVKDIEQYHSAHASLPIDKPVMDTPNPDNYTALFSGEEGYGKYVDLHSVYTMYLSLPFSYDTSPAAGKQGAEALASLRVCERISYTDWLKHCTAFRRLPRKGKNIQYKEYLQAMLEYLKSFYKRTHPLGLSVEKILSDAQAEFEASWAAGGVPGWDGVTPVDVPQGRKPTKKERQVLFQKSVAGLELSIDPLWELLQEAKVRTIAMIDRKETKSKEEIDAEIQREEDEARSIYEANYSTAIKKATEEVDDFPEVKLNPKNLPLGFDGQPIPHWLYKLHGLKEKFRCEICRDHTYIGPLAFDKHFQEARHAHGMRCLGIPNTAHFHHVTSVQEALALWRKIKTDATVSHWDRQQEVD
eukprot:TRINITY_DN21409_c0_g1_i1.p1 TRINITY_DN21409_c0_g1~~TRINITY_DN21409_c0_g1_i1.p1  ORF type:complete len:438 (+),score=187.83 TRINITY_DN21409_c0_g1_i1:51-1364(+)